MDASKVITRSFKQIDLFYLIQGSLHLLCKSEVNLIFFWVHFHLRWRCHAACWAQTFRRDESSVEVWLKDFPTLWTWLEVTLREIISGLRLLIKLFWSKSSSGRKFKLLCSLKAKYNLLWPLWSHHVLFTHHSHSTIPLLILLYWMVKRVNVGNTPKGFPRLMAGTVLSLEFKEIVRANVKTCLPVTPSGSEKGKTDYLKDIISSWEEIRKFLILSVYWVSSYNTLAFRTIIQNNRHLRCLLTHSK